MEGLISIFREVRDPRDFNARHELGSMLFISLAATLCGAKSCSAIADFGEANEQELAEIVDLQHGVPSHDCFSRVFRLLDPDEIGRAFLRFAVALREGLGLGPAKGVVAIDGKRLRRGYERGRACLPPLMVSVWDAETRLSLASQAGGGGDEVAATLAVLKTLTLKGCLVTGDALHCHPRMAAAVRDSGAHYALKLKLNHGPLYACAETAFAHADTSGKLASHEEREKAHDREEWRRASVVALPADVPVFPHLTAFGRIETERHSNGKSSRRVHYVIMSKRLSPRRTLEVMRTHWSVENELHWRLDVVFNEDDARTRKNYAPQILSFLRRMALDILRSHPDNRSIARKMNLAAWKKEFFYELFAYMR
jgi:predicted transposase YbfD/YdcC